MEEEVVRSTAADGRKEQAMAPRNEGVRVKRKRKVEREERVGKEEVRINDAVIWRRKDERKRYTKKRRKRTMILDRVYLDPLYAKRVVLEK